MFPLVGEWISSIHSTPVISQNLVVIRLSVKTSAGCFSDSMCDVLIKPETSHLKYSLDLFEFLLDSDIYVISYT